MLILAGAFLLGSGLRTRPRFAGAGAPPPTPDARRGVSIAREGDGAPLLSVDPAVDTISRIVARRFEDRRNVVTDRLLDRFDEVAHVLEEIDSQRARCVRRAAGWTQIEAPVRAEEGGKEPAMKARLRFLKHDADWKLDQLRLLPLEPAS